MGPRRRLPFERGAVPTSSHGGRLVGGGEKGQQDATGIVGGPVTITNNIDNSKNIDITKNIDNSKNIDDSKNISINKSIVINKGAHDGVSLNQAVVDGSGGRFGAGGRL